MVLWPFKKKEDQKVFSLIPLIVGILLMFAAPSIFIIGLIFAFIGVFYLIESQ